MRLDEIEISNNTSLNPNQVQQLLLLIVKQARLKKREATTGFKQA